MPKMEAHQKAILHRAFSVFILNERGELMLQQRAHDKYHSPSLWTNTCCSHQREGEGNVEAGKRRLEEEMGFTTDLTELFHFIYQAPFENGLTEHELDHVLLGYYQGMHLSHLRWMSSILLGHHNVPAECDIFLIAACPLWSKVSTIVLKVTETTIW